MKNQLYIPKKIKIGYQKRKDTYSDLLGYVIYYDEKGVLRKETSWRSWIDKGVSQGSTRSIYNTETQQWDQIPLEPRDPLPTSDHDNNPLEGFVLNKRVGGGSSSHGWHQRDTKCRVWDPRGFEIEIDIPNLLFILQETNSIKGKGLEGEFVYAWDGKDLVLLPVSCQEYQNSVKFSDLRVGKVSVKELVPGYSYENKKQQILTYLGRFDSVFKAKSWHDTVSLDKYFVFVDKDGNYNFLDNVSSISRLTNGSIISNFADLIEGLSKNDDSPNIKELVKEYISYNLTSKGYYGSEKAYSSPCIEESEGIFTQYNLYAEYSTDYRSGYGRMHKILGFRVVPVRKLIYSNGIITIKNITRKTAINDTPVTSLDDINKMNFITLSVIVNSGKQYKITN